MNACPPAYRNLTPKAEADLRSIRLGIVERPGSVPNPNRGDAPEVLAAKRAAVVLDFIADGHNTRAKMRAVANGAYWLDIALESLLASGRVTATPMSGIGNPKRYELTK